MSLFCFSALKTSVDSSESFFSIVDSVGRNGQEFIFLPCGLCSFCWESTACYDAGRVTDQLKRCETAHFITLSYAANEQRVSRSDISSFDHGDFHAFIKRLRRCISRYRQVSPGRVFPMEFYFVGEFNAATGLFFYHGIFFNVPEAVVDQLSGIWRHGAVHVGPVDQASIGLVTRFISCSLNVDSFGQALPLSRPLISKGISSRFVSIGGEPSKRDFFSGFNVIGNGFPMRLPVYARHKLRDSYRLKRLPFY